MHLQDHSPLPVLRTQNSGLCCVELWYTPKRRPVLESILTCYAIYTLNPLLSIISIGIGIEIQLWITVLNLYGKDDLLIVSIRPLSKRLANAKYLKSNLIQFELVVHVPKITTIFIVNVSSTFLIEFRYGNILPTARCGKDPKPGDKNLNDIIFLQNGKRW